MPVENLHAGLGVGVVGWLETDVLEAEFLEELFDHAHQVSERQVAVHHQAFDLVELGEVGGVEGLIPEHSVDTEVLFGGELLLLRQAVQHLGRDGGGVSAEQVLLGLGYAPRVPVPERLDRGGSGVLGPAYRAVAYLVGSLDLVLVVFGDGEAGGRVLDEERVLHVASGVRLGLEERVEVPERRLHEAVRRHLLEAHLQENLPELRADLEEGVEAAGPAVLPQRLEVVGLELGGLPTAVAHHLHGDVGSSLRARRSILRALGHRVGLVVGRGDELALLQLVEVCLGRKRPRLYGGELVLNSVGDVGGRLEDLAALVLVDLEPLALHALRQPDLRHRARQLLYLILRNACVRNQRENLCLRRSVGDALLSFRRQLPPFMVRWLDLNIIVRDERLEDANECKVLEALLLGEIQ
mmetsp:Transcript_32088/g.76699  ORF Transcript_32088/g.76699 Transcript_32088/m.76699 type:complete len:411 (-) Transcript_32088:84-1316(-)